MASAVLVAVIAGGASVWLYSRTDPVVRYPIRVDISPPGRVIPPLSMSPDGRSLIFVVSTASNTRDFYVHSFDTGETRQLMNGVSAPVIWSPDNRSLAFAAQGKLQRMDAAGKGPAEPVCDVGGFAGGTWTSGNVILFGAKGGIMQVAASGGTPVLRTKVDQKRDESATFCPGRCQTGATSCTCVRARYPTTRASSSAVLMPHLKRRI
jgi:hypothetical protein